MCVHPSVVMADTATPETAVDVVTDSLDRDVNYVSIFVTNISSAETEVSTWDNSYL